MAAIARVVDRGWFVLGPELETFETEFARYCGVAHAVGVANGTDAIELALRALGVACGDEVIVAANAGFYSTTALRAIGAQPVYADVDQRHLNIDPAAAAMAITPHTKAIIATHLYGRMADVAGLRELCSRHGLALLEDCAQAHGARRGGIVAGAWGDAAAFSFYPTKNLGALGDAGLVTCPDDRIALRLRRLRQYGWKDKYVAIDGPARNSRLDEIQAAVLRERLPTLDERNKRRREIAITYAAVRHPAITHPDVDGDDYIAHLYVVRTSHREALREHLRGRGIASDVHYPVLDADQPVLCGQIARCALPVSAQATAEIVSLPCYPEMTDAEVSRVSDALATWKP
ncbi:MAG: DegT/DnrJ/EryC1/StrS family aminotransferase [Xanthomonadaceae bacterium]|nr:DegT/DnrJ/EryC1/StrS family aminotransferase [Xanthomonadaceae bacterium]MDE1885245.1 DegT/DnrJ/EryC1/StrS family aminotransferase [Xanthomonadaceae bacterium]MDE1961668.1 DegT/DnrJ/EryC1/StrS family aminotransferase [Xanthomonadaceae bacterium]MDE2085513.1 DegT/DnrJ/EryC1/StrS family aminotransferase [Xanthomonadaceae bacterium]MDE2258340.1 DegT/DnrJ/EryC1/StrS family aminotransferase [Xanthomonadaceae bacterium]